MSSFLQNLSQTNQMILLAIVAVALYLYFTKNSLDLSEVDRGTSGIHKGSSANEIANYNKTQLATTF